MKPLAGERILVTRDSRGSAELAAEVRKRGGEAIVVPLIELVPPEDSAHLTELVQEIETFDWILFTSANAVRFFFEAGAAVPREPKICAIGPVTRAAITSRGAAVDLMPAEYTAEGVVASFAKIDLLGKRILLPRAAVARDLVPEALIELGASVEIAEVYRNVLPSTAAAGLKRAFTEGAKPDWITFASSSAVKNFLACMGAAVLGGPAASGDGQTTRVRVASIGPSTSSVLAMHGIPVDAEAKEHTASGLADAIAAYSSTSTSEPSTSE